MMKVPFTRLPAYFQSNPVFQHVYNYVYNANAMLGMILYQRNDQKFLILKDGTLHVPFDWQAYSLMRAASRLLIISGQSIRQEKGVFLKRESYGDPYVDQLYQSLLSSKKQKVVICTRKMTESQMLSQLNPQLYQLVKIPKFRSLANLLQEALKVSQAPILVEYGLKALGGYFQDVKKGQPNKLDTLILTSFHGSMPAKNIGQKFQIPLDNYYQKAWESEKIPCKLHNNSDGQMQIQVFTIKK